MSQCFIHTIPVLEDNYAYVIESGSIAIVVDPGEAEPVVKFLASRKINISAILLTHYDYDHVGGVPSLRSPGVQVLGPTPSPIPLDGNVREGREFNIGGVAVQVIDTPGHAFPHVAYYLPDPGALFSGDCLFGAGCGRLSGAAATKAMWTSLQAINRLHADTSIYFGHEYTLSNLAFARHVDPENTEITARVARESARLENGRPSSPTTLERERQTNPFLRVNSPAIRRRLGLLQAPDAEVFATLRSMKNSYRG